MKELSLSRYLFLSLVFHVIILLFFILGFDIRQPLAVLENTNQQDIISAVVLGDTSKSKILTPQSSVMSAPKEKPIEKQSIEKKTVAEDKQNAIPLAKKEKQKKLEIKPVFGQDLLADIKKEKQKQKKKKEKALQDHFKKTLQAQTEKSLRQQLLNDDIKLKSQTAHLSQGEINKYKALIVQAIGENWLVPPGTNQKLICELMIRVAKSGKVIDVQIYKSSGDQALDRSARAAVLKASPLPVPKDEKEFEAFKQFALKVRPENVVMRT